MLSSRIMCYKETHRSTCHWGESVETETTNGSTSFETKGRKPMGKQSRL